MADSDDDDDLKRAIAMSLTASQPTSDVVDLTSEDEDDDDLRRAIALSQQDGQASTPASPYPADSLTAVPKYDSTAAPKLDAHARTETSTIEPVAASTRPYSLASMDRKAMEQERLARLGKRKRNASPDRPSKLVAKPPTHQASLAEPATTAEPSTSTGLQYPRGVIKRTWAHKHPRSDDIKIEEVFQASDLNIAVISAFQFDTAWVLTKLNPNKHKQIWFMNAKEAWLRQKMLDELKESDIKNLKPHFPPMGGKISSMHSKLMVLVHEKYLRIVVPTANMIKFDWGETNKDAKGESWQPAVMENSVFLIDLPRRPENKPAEKAETMFGNELVNLLRAQEAPRNIVDGVLKFDFSETGHLAFVHSIGGSHTDAAADSTGFPGLAKALRKLKLDSVEKLELDYATSSLGALNPEFLTQLYMSASGRSLSDKVASDFLSHIRVYYPTADTVKNSTGGPDCGGIITLSRAHYNAVTFPKQCLRDYKSTRPGVLSHSKMLLARGVRKDGSPFAWAYVGSANLTESAWGRQKILKTGKPGSLSIRNWECGVVVPVPEEKWKGLQLAAGEVPDMAVFEGTVEVPFQYPGEEYAGKRPWFFRD